MESKEKWVNIEWQLNCGCVVLGWVNDAKVISTEALQMSAFCEKDHKLFRAFLDELAAKQATS